MALDSRDHPAAPRNAVAVVLMGVAGSGKTTIGRSLAAALGWSFRDADEFHPVANIAKMTAGLALDDADRLPWLAAIRHYLQCSLAEGNSVVVSCSALRERYRELIRPPGATVKLVYLHGEFALIWERLSQRRHHFMKESMLRSQFATLEPPADAFAVDIALPPAAIVRQIRQEFGL